MERQKKEAAIQLRNLSKILKLENILRKRYRTLSGGQKRRCEIAAALMHTPEILFLDEPTTGLDPATRQDVWHAITNLQRNEKITVFLTTHYMEEATRSDNIIILDHGKIIDSGSAYDLKEKYASDKLRLYYSFQSEHIIIEKLEALAKQNRIIRKKDGLEIVIQNTLEAIPIVQTVREQLDGFEVIQGTMDDVFIHAVESATEEMHKWNN